MKIAVAAHSNAPDAQVDQRFGRAQYFAVFDDEKNDFGYAHNLQNLSLPQGAGIQAAKNVVETGAGALIARNVGPKAFDLLQRAGMELYICESEITVREAVGLYKSGALVRLENSNAEGHW